MLLLSSLLLKLCRQLRISKKWWPSQNNKSSTALSMEHLLTLAASEVILKTLSNTHLTIWFSREELTHTLEKLNSARALNSLLQSKRRELSFSLTSRFLNLLIPLKSKMTSRTGQLPLLSELVMTFSDTILKVSSTRKTAIQNSSTTNMITPCLLSVMVTPLWVAHTSSSKTPSAQPGVAVAMPESQQVSKTMIMESAESIQNLFNQFLSQRLKFSLSTICWKNE